MGKDDILTDDYVADLLAKEAKDCSLKYSTMGMEAYASSSRPTKKLKPNTRFLQNIIRDTKHHNDTLSAKEQSESQARLQELAGAEEETRRKYKPNADEMRGRQLGSIAALLQGGQKRKRGATDENASELRKARAAEDARRLADTAAARRQQRNKDGKRRNSLERYRVRGGTDGEDAKERARRQNTSSDEEVEERAKNDRKRTARSRSPERSPRKHRERSPLRQRRKEKSEEESSDRPSHRNSKAAERSSERVQGEETDSDPLDDLIGPAPPPKVLPRGRGALRGLSGINSRFSSAYDPKSDVQLEDDNDRDDWDEALESLRDRAQYRQQGADRLRAAGFTDGQVNKWEKGGEKTIDDVQWTKAGEKREWDRGKDAEQDDDG